jgi:flavin reductase (DIM6/NTAB) family NADH-FMN oxidoreductase RutF
MMVDGADPRSLRSALGCFATGVAIVTAQVPGAAPAGVTINSFASLSLDPPLVLWSLAARSPSLARFRAAAHFAINVLAADQEALARRFASPTPDKFAGHEWREGLGGAPVLPDCAARFECSRVAETDQGDHMLFTGRILRFWKSERDALIFYRGRYVREVRAE